MEEAEEKMAALKRAYADIILNMAKESAARVLASESRALRFQQDLMLTKEDALSTLLRVKGIMDSKISKAERVSLGQVRRIQELEIQLAEAESTIEHLNNELKILSDELANMKKNQTESLDEQCTSKSHRTAHDNICQKSLTQGTAGGQCCLLFNNVSQVERSEDFSAKKNSVGHPDLASIIMRSKEPELYRNGCTQRIRAFEQNILTRDVSPGQIDDQFLKNKCFVCETTEDPFVGNSLETDNMLTRSKNTNGSKDAAQQGGSCERGKIKLVQRFSLQSKRTRSKRLGPSMGNASSLVVTDHEPSVSPLFNPSVGMKVTGDGEAMQKANSEASKKVLHCHLAPESNGSCTDSEDGRNHLELSIEEDRPALLKSQNKVHVDSAMNSSCLNSDSQIYPRALSNAEATEPENAVRAPQLCSKTDMSSGVLSEGSVKNNGDSTLIPKEQSWPKQRKVENLDTSILEMDTGRKSTNLINPESTNGKSVNSSGASPQGTSSRLLKYTFTRKRKRGSSTSINENVLPEKKNSLKRRFGDKESALPDPQKPILLAGSSRDSRRLAQVARQLISLSEKRW